MVRINIMMMVVNNMSYWNMNNDEFMENLRKELPPIFTRETASKMTGGLFSPRTLSNFDAAGNGPKSKHYFAKKVVYEKDEFLIWLKSMVCDKKHIQQPQQKINCW